MKFLDMGFVYFPLVLNVAFPTLAFPFNSMSCKNVTQFSPGNFHLYGCNNFQTVYCLQITKQSFVEP